MFSKVKFAKTFSKQTARLRVICWMGIVGNPILGFVANQFYPEQTDPLWARFALSGILLSSYILLDSNQLSELKRDFQLLPGALAATVYSLLMVATNGWVANQAVNMVLVATIVFTIFDDERMAWSYCVFLWSCAIAVAAYRGDIGDGIQIMLSCGVASMLGMVAIFARHDATMENQAFEKAADSVLENMTDGVIVYDANSIITFVNPAASRILGVQSKDLIGTKATDSIWICAKEDGSDIALSEYPSQLALLSGQAIHDYLMRIQRADGSLFFVSVHAVPVFIAGSTTPAEAIVTFRDVTELRASDQRIKEQQALIVNASRLSAMGEFASGVIHEISNPLSILGMRIAQLRMYVEKGEKEPGQTLETVNQVDKTVKRIGDIIRSMRALSRGRSEQPPESIAVVDLIKEAREAFQIQLHRAEIELKVNVDPELKLTVRAGLVLQILINLVNNAIYAIQDFEEKWIAIDASEKDGMVFISVTDCGKGIPAEVVKNLMQPFYTTKPLGKGTGIGLSISRKIAADHGGELRYSNKSGHTSFILSLPQKPVASASPEATQAS
jgi:PAS domain S-box-containing protein